MARRPLAFLGLATILAGCQTASTSAVRPVPAGLETAEWAHFGGNLGSNQYSPLVQIDRTNVSQLGIVWEYDVGDPTTVAAPLIADGIMYIVRNADTLVALDPETGREIWVAEGAIDRTRGLSYWRSADGRESRLLFCKNQALRAVDARTGRPITDFGVDGAVDLRLGLGRNPARIGSIAPIAGGKVVGDIIIMGSNTGEGYGSPPGDIRAYNVRTGKLVWQFHTIPHPGEPGYDSWPKDAWQTMGGVNNWGGMAVDEALGIAYLGLGSSTYDFWGGDRKGDNLYANSLIALDIRTGKLVWHYQLVHHDLWDYDVTSSPVLMQVRRDGRMIDAVVQATKQGMVFVFDRATGKPVFPIEERPVPKSEMEDDVASPTQPFSALPPFARLRFTEADIDPNLPEEERRAFASQVRAARNDGLFTPPGLRDTVQMPGNHGGVNWGMVAGEPRSGRFYVSSFDLPTMMKLEKMDGQPAGGYATPKDRGRAVYKNNCAICHGDKMQGQPAIPALQGVVARLGSTEAAKTIMGGRNTMPAFAGSLEQADIDAVIAFLDDPSETQQPVMPAVSRGLPVDAQAHGASGPDLSNAGKGRWYSSYGFMVSAKTFLPAIKPPWTTITAYDLNEGKIIWQVPLGGVPGYPVAQTGVSRSKGGLIVTEGGLIIATSSDDRKIHAYDRDTGKLLWEHELPSIPQGVPAIYAVRGRQYIAVPVAYYFPSGMSPIGPSRGPKGRNSYVVFALPTKR